MEQDLTDFLGHCTRLPRRRMPVISTRAWNVSELHRLLSVRAWEDLVDTGITVSIWIFSGVKVCRSVPRAGSFRGRCDPSRQSREPLWVILSVESSM